MEYIKELRKSIGHKPISMCSCGCLIFNNKNQVLLQKRSDDNLWGNPGGSMELGETIFDTIIREIKEETNLDINKKDLKLFNIYSGENQHHIYPNKDEIYFVNIIFETNITKGILKKDIESNELKFFDIDKLPLNVTKPFEHVRKDLLLRYNNPEIKFI